MDDIDPPRGTPTALDELEAGLLTRAAFEEQILAQVYLQNRNLFLKCKAIEVKLTSRPGRDDLAALNANADLIDADKRFLVCRRAEYITSGNQVICDLDRMLRILS